MSRGVSEEEAKRLVVRGFFATVLQRIGVPSVVEHLMESIDAELAATESIQASIDAEAAPTLAPDSTSSTNKEN